MRADRRFSASGAAGSRRRRGRVAALALLAAMAAAAAVHGGAFIAGGLPTNPPAANPALPVAAISHPHGYSGTGGAVTLNVCLDSTAANASLAEISLRNAIDTWNQAQTAPASAAVANNLAHGHKPSRTVANTLDFESVMLHEIGHCFGLAHPNLGTESAIYPPFTTPIAAGDVRLDFTRSRPGPDGELDVEGLVNQQDLAAGLDGRIGSSDDQRADDVNLLWFETGASGGNPFVNNGSVFDASTWSQNLANLPAGQSFPANGDRRVAKLLGLGTAEAVMQQGAFQQESQRRLAADDVGTALLARSGLDLDATTTADNYTLTLAFAGIKVNAASDPTCDVVVESDNAPSTADVAQCSLSMTQIGATDHYQIDKPATITYHTTVSWTYNPTRRGNNDVPIPFDDVYAMRVGDPPLVVSAADGVRANDQDDFVLPGATTLAGLQVVEVASSDPLNHLALNADGSFTYTPAAGFVGFETFQYDLLDGALVPGCNSATTSCPRQSMVRGEIRFAVYPARIQPYLPKKLAEPRATLFAENLKTGEGVAIAGDIAAVSTPDRNRERLYQGEVSVYERNLGGADRWGLRKTLAAPVAPAKHATEFGMEVALAPTVAGDPLGETLFVAAPYSDGRGTVYVYRRNAEANVPADGTPDADEWGLVATLVNPYSDESIFGYGFQVAVDGDRALIGHFGAPSTFCNPCQWVDVHERNAGGADAWGKVAQLSLPAPFHSAFGVGELALSGDRAIVPAIGSNDNCPGTGCGKVYVFERDAGGSGSWGIVQQLQANSPVDFENFGRAVSLSGNTLVVGAYQAADQCPAGCPSDQPCRHGAAYVFDRSGGTFSQVKRLLPSNGFGSCGNQHLFGATVRLHGSQLMIGARDDDQDAGQSRGTNSGGVYFFERNQGGANNWGEVTRFTGADVDAWDDFGVSLNNGLDFDGDRVIAGAAFASDGERTLSFDGGAYLFDVLPPAAPTADVRLEKLDSPDPVVQTQPVTYTLRVVNDGPSPTVSGTVSDTFDATRLSGVTASAGCTVGAGTIACTYGVIPAGGAVVFTYQGTTAAAAADYTLTATAQIGSPAPTDPTTGAFNQAAQSTLVQLPTGANLTLDKTGFPGTVVSGSGQVTYSIAVANIGNQDATAVKVVDTPESGSGFVYVGSNFPCAPNGVGGLDCTLGAIAAGSAKTLTITFTYANVGTHTNSATASIVTGAPDPQPANNTDSTDTVVISSATTADLAVDQTPLTNTGNPATVIAGSRYSYRVEVRNTSATNSAAGVVLTDTLPGPAAPPADRKLTFLSATASNGGSCGHSAGVVTCALGSIPPNGLVTVDIRVDLRSSEDAGTVLTNSASVTAQTSDPGTGNNSDSSPASTVQTQVDLTISKSGPGTVPNAGTAFAYSFAIGSVIPEDFAQGPSDARNLVVTDTLPVGLTFVSASSPAACTAGAPGPGGQLVTCSLPDLQRGVIQIFTMTVLAGSGTSGQALTNCAQVASSTTDPTPGTTQSCAATVTPTRRADLQVVSKDDGVSQVTVGGATTYTIVVRNNGPSDATTATVADTFPATQFTQGPGNWTCSATAGSSCTASGTGNINDAVSIVAGGQLTYTVPGTIPLTATGTLTNTASVSTTAGVDPVTGNNSANDSDQIIAEADLGVTKTDNRTYAVPGTTVQYDIQVTRTTGPESPVDATVTDTFPPELTGCTWTCNTTAPSECDASGTGPINDAVKIRLFYTLFYTVTCTVAEPLTPGSLVSNTAAVAIAAPLSDPEPGNNSATDTDTVRALDFGDAPESYRTLRADGADPDLLADDGARHGIVAGVSLGAEVDSESEGQPTTAADGDDLAGTPDDEDGVVFPGDLVACETGNVTVTASVAGRLTAWIDWNGNGVFENSAERVFVNTDVTAGANPLTVNVPCDAAPTAQTFSRWRFTAAAVADNSLAIFDPTGAAVDGEVEDHPVAVRGVDFGDAPDSFGFGGFPVRRANNGGRHLLTAGGPLLGAAIDADPDAWAGVGTGDDTNGVDDEDGVTMPAVLFPGQTQPITVTVTGSSDAYLQGWVDYYGLGSWGASNQVFMNQLVHPGPNVLNVTVPSDVDTFVSGLYARFRLTSAPATVSDNGTPGNPADDFTSPAGLAPDGEVEDYRFAIAAVGDLAIAKDDGQTTAVPGAPITYTLTVTNTGDTMLFATIADTFPATLTGVTWSCVATGGNCLSATSGSGDLNHQIHVSNGGSVVFTVNATVAPGATGTLVNTATITPSATTFDPDTSDNSATDTDTLTPVSDLAIVKSDGVGSAIPGSAVIYTLTVTNAGPSDATGAAIADDFDIPGTYSSVTWSCVADAGSSCGPTPGTGDIAGTVDVQVGDTVTYTATATIASDRVGTAANTATIALASDPDPSDDSSTDVDTLTPQGDLRIAKVDSPAAGTSAPGGPIVWTITVVNDGPSRSVGATVSDLMPPELVATPPPTWTCSAGPGATCTASGSGNISDVVTIPALGSVAYTVSGTIAAAATGTISNTATVTAGTAVDPDPGDNSATDTNTLAPVTDLQLTKTDNGPWTGADIVYTLTVRNNGPSASTGGTVSDTLPPEVTLVSAPGCTGTTSLTCAFGALAPSATATFTVTVSVNLPVTTGAVTNTASVTANETDTTAGNDSDSVATTLDTTPPTVTAIDTLATTPGGSLDQCETARVDVQQVVVTFSEAMYNPDATTPGSVTNPQSYRLVRPSAGQPFAVGQCSDPLGSDVAVSVGAVSWDGANNRATLTVNQGSRLSDGIHRLLLCGTLRDAAGNHLDGDGAGPGGPSTDLVRSFRVDARNWLADAHFDTYDPACPLLAAWTPGNPSTVAVDTPDASGSPLSGSAHNTTPNLGFSLSQCAVVGNSGTAELRTALRVNTTAAIVSVAPMCTLYSGAGCAGTVLGAINQPTAITGSTGAGFLRFSHHFAVPVGATSVRCTFTASGPAANTFDLYLDELFLGTTLLFSDGFENGALTRWNGGSTP